ncbi:hypothetical protein Tco_1503349 [Tanacetum coccineum]
MMYLPQTIGRQRDKDNAGAMIQKTKRSTINSHRTLVKIMLAISHNVNNEKYIKSPTHYPCDFARTSSDIIHSDRWISMTEPRSTMLIVGDLILKDGGEVKEFQRSFRHSDTERLSQSDEVLELKNFKKDATLKLFKSTNQERCSRSHSRQAEEQAQDLKSMITTSNHKLMIKVKRAQD